MPRWQLRWSLFKDAPCQHASLHYISLYLFTTKEEFAIRDSRPSRQSSDVEDAFEFISEPLAPAFKSKVNSGPLPSISRAAAKALS